MVSVNGCGLVAIKCLHSAYSVEFYSGDEIFLISQVTSKHKT